MPGSVHTPYLLFEMQTVSLGNAQRSAKHHSGTSSPAFRFVVPVRQPDEVSIAGVNIEGRHGDLMQGWGAFDSCSLRIMSSFRINQFPFSSPACCWSENATHDTWRRQRQDGTPDEHMPDKHGFDSPRVLSVFSEQLYNFRL